MLRMSGFFLNCATEAWFETQTCIILSFIRMHLIQHLLSNIQKYVRQEYKELRLVKGTLNECEVKTAKPRYSVSTL